MLTGKELMNKWLEALRSGKYKQGRHYLRQKCGGEIQHCCLGVLCEIAVENGATIRTTEDTLIHDDKRPELDEIRTIWDDSTSLISEDLFDYMGLPLSGRDGLSLAEANDCGTKFSELADEIEEKFLPFCK